ncbi:MAG: NTP transferase domain-containing protein [Propionibacteriaceae bacterium]|jgi:mannose-1-phosphate guanylyltransferase|nr:NTP transferase domain-containing protein [Propionibacteriaceae bacterium]
MDYAVIMAGGAGTRLWPLSRRGMPKQLLPVINGRSLLQLAFERACTVIDPRNVIVCAGRAYRDLICAQLPQLPPENVLAEPLGRDSMAAVTWSVATIAQRDSSATVAILSADHVIEPMAGFTAALKHALAVASADDQALVTFAVKPTSPHTGFGYLHLGASSDTEPPVFPVLQFAEKPSVAVAQTYLKSGRWWWNSGMFCWRADTFLRQAAQLQPKLAEAITALVEDPAAIDQIYPALTKISVDYAVMEPVSHGVTEAHVLAIELSAQWADVGGFPALAHQLGVESGNAIVGDAVVLNSTGNLIWSKGGDGRLIAVSGVHDMVVVQDGDVTLVCPMDQAESVKQLVDLARDMGEQYA